MKTMLKSVLLVTGTAAVMSSCVKQEALSHLNPGAASVLNSTITTIVLLQANQNNTAGTFTWSAADFGYKAAVNYTLQFAKDGNFGSSATMTEVNVGTAKSKTFTVKELNDKMQEIMGDGVPTQVRARVKADVGSGVAPIYSNVVTMTVTSYLDIVTYTYPDAMNIAGNYQGWNPATAPQIVRTRNGGYQHYEGYIVFNDASPQFKMVKGNNWGAGDFGSAGGSNLGNGGPNLTLPAGGPGIAGLYRIRANTTAMTWSYNKINTFGIIGSATAGGWGASTPMVFNASNGSWSITTDLVVGEMKFRANNDWGINFGDNSPADGKPEYDGANIAVPSAGNYTITLNIGIGGNYSYKLRRN
ncbi:MAG TPA: SusE domain-containing protein [Chitinophagaceae bacterium]|nr:SusE domain-containing protein [Chitinophagaceae bacterium]